MNRLFQPTINWRRPRGILFLLFFVLFLPFGEALRANPIDQWLAEADRFGGNQWESLGQKGGVRLARKRVGKHGLFAVRGETVIEAPLGKVASVLYDEARWAEWSDRTDRAHLISKTEDGVKKVYQAVDMPFILSDRDLVYHFGYTQRDGQVIFVGRSFPDVTDPKTIGVRMSLIEGRWFLTPVGTHKTQVVLEILMDPKGRLPKWFVDLVQKDYPVGMLKSLSKQSNRADVKPLL